MLSPLLRLLQSCQRLSSSHGLEDIDGLLGCPVTMFPPTLLEDWHTNNAHVQEGICFALFYATNWYPSPLYMSTHESNISYNARLRELLNTFSSMESNKGFNIETTHPLKTMAKWFFLCRENCGQVEEYCRFRTNAGKMLCKNTHIDENAGFIHQDNRRKRRAIRQIPHHFKNTKGRASLFSTHLYFKDCCLFI